MKEEQEKVLIGLVYTRIHTRRTTFTTTVRIQLYSTSLSP